MKEELTGVIITGFILLLLIGIGSVLRAGKGAFLISGYNMLSQKDKEKYNEKALCRFVGNMLYVIALLLFFVVIGAIYKITWLMTLFIVVLFTFTIGCLVYANTNNRFKK